MKLTRLVVVLALFAACSTRPKATEPTTESKTVMVTPPNAGPGNAPAEPLAIPDGLVLEVKQTETQDPAPAANIVAKTTPLSDKDADKVFARLPALEADPTAQTTFAMREKSLPVPKTGTKEQLPWPPKETEAKKPPAPPVTPLTVRRYGPTGEVPIAADLAITFSQPMVAIGTVDQTKAQVPVKLTPEPEGQWQWLGTQTVTFKPTVRMPMATKFTVEVAKGTKSANGGALADGLSYSFATPPLNLTGKYPDSATSVQLEPVIFLGFDQRVSPKELLSSIKVDAGGKVDIRAATADEVAKDPYVSALMQQCEPDRCMAIKAVKPLPKATNVTITVQRGAPSAEGPLKTTKDQKFAFVTYGPFFVTRIECWSDPCSPESPVTLQLSNPLDLATYKDGMVHHDPGLLKTRRSPANGSYIQIAGAQALEHQVHDHRRRRPDRDSFKRSARPP